jgi:hypothetical protein
MKFKEYINEGNDKLKQQVVDGFENLFHRSYDSYVAATSAILDQTMEYFDDVDIWNRLSTYSDSELRKILKELK